MLAIHPSPSCADPKRGRAEGNKPRSEIHFAGYLLDSGVYGPAAGRRHPAQSRGTAPPGGCQSNYLSQAHTQLHFFSRGQCVRILFLVLFGTASLAWSQKTDKNDFFESKIRPILLTRCGSCHGDKVQMGGKQFTSRDGVHVSGVVVPGDPSASRLIQAVQYEG